MKSILLAIILFAGGASANVWETDNPDDFLLPIKHAYITLPVWIGGAINDSLDPNSYVSVVSDVVDWAGGLF